MQSPETLAYQPVMTQEARKKAADETPEVPDPYNAGNLLVKPGELIDDLRLDLLQTRIRRTGCPRQHARTAGACRRGVFNVSRPGRAVRVLPGR